jgi:predicted transcriptional regulator
MSEHAELPPVLALIAEAAGKDVALKIARQHGGTRVTMPQHARGKNWLSGLVGPVAAQAVIVALGSTRRIDIPLGPEGGYVYSRNQLARRFAEMQAEGASETEIARALGVTGRAIRKRRAKDRQRVPSGQPDLFG